MREREQNRERGETGRDKREKETEREMVKQIARKVYKPHIEKTARDCNENLSVSEMNIDGQLIGLVLSIQYSCWNSI